jgi:hypothetical protein
MPSNFLLDNRSLEYPVSNDYDLRGFHREIYNRYYSAYIRRLQSVGYSFPSVHPVREAFGSDLQSSFISKKSEGLYLDPGTDKRWLSFVALDGELLMFVARYVIRAKNVVQLFGDGAEGIQFDLKDDDVTVSGCVVSRADIRGLESAGVFVL